MSRKDGKGGRTSLEDIRSATCALRRRTIPTATCHCAFTQTHNLVTTEGHDG